MTFVPVMLLDSVRRSTPLRIFTTPAVALLRPRPKHNKPPITTRLHDPLITVPPVALTPASQNIHKNCTFCNGKMEKSDCLRLLCHGIRPDCLNLVRGRRRPEPTPCLAPPVVRKMLL